MKFKKKLIIFLLLFVTITLMAWCPWVNESSINTIAEKQNWFIPDIIGEQRVVRKIPFGAIARGNVSAGPNLPAFSEETYFVSPIFTVHKID